MYLREIQQKNLPQEVIHINLSIDFKKYFKSSTQKN